MESALSIDKHSKCILSDFNIDTCNLFPYVKHFRTDHPNLFYMTKLYG